MLGHRGAPLLNEADATTPEPSRPTTRPAGRRVASVPVDSVPIEAAFAPYAGKRRAATLIEERPEPQAASVDAGPDTATIERVLRDLQPVDQTTSFATEDTTRLTIPERSRAPRVETAPSPRRTPPAAAASAAPSSRSRPAAGPCSPRSRSSPASPPSPSPSPVP